MSMSIREVINALMNAKDLDKECVIEVNRIIFNNAVDEYDWAAVHIEKIANCDWGSAIEGEKEGEAE